MSRRFGVLVGALMVLGLVVVGDGSASAATCTTTGFIRDGINMTAALINPTGKVSGDIDATGCNIAVYFDRGSGTIVNADVHGANYFGVVVNGDVNAVAVDITNSSVHQIGETPFNGAQHGNAIYYRAFGTGSTSGNVWNNKVFKYQKNGITGNGPGTTLSVRDNTVTGEGPVPYIGQNGIQIGYGANASVMRNSVSGNAYTGPNFASSGGILVVGGDGYGGPYTTGIQIDSNALTGNDVGVWLSNLDASFNAPTTATNNKVVNNTITNGALTNTTGNGATPYQAGVSDVGNNDKIISNTISGAGYDPATLPGSTFAIDADASFTNRPKVHANTTP